jgi:hypothetical protein
MADKGDWIAIQKYLAAHNVKVERASDSPASKSQRTDAGASSSMTMDASGLEPPPLYPHSTVLLFKDLKTLSTLITSLSYSNKRNSKLNPFL